jgi:hypothetical protein
VRLALLPCCRRCCCILGDPCSCAHAAKSCCIIMALPLLLLPCPARVAGLALLLLLLLPLPLPLLQAGQGQPWQLAPAQQCCLLQLTAATCQPVACC